MNLKIKNGTKNLSSTRLVSRKSVPIDVPFFRGWKLTPIPYVTPNTCVLTHLFVQTFLVYRLILKCGSKGLSNDRITNIRCTLECLYVDFFQKLQICPPHLEIANFDFLDIRSTNIALEIQAEEKIDVQTLESTSYVDSEVHIAGFFRCPTRVQQTSKKVKWDQNLIRRENCVSGTLWGHFLKALTFKSDRPGTERMLT